MDAVQNTAHNFSVKKQAKANAVYCLKREPLTKSMEMMWSDHYISVIRIIFGSLSCVAAQSNAYITRAMNACVPNSIDDNSHQFCSAN